MIHFSKQSGMKKTESLVEVIMAIFVVAMGSAVATSLIVSALQSNAFSRDNLIALNLAIEGVEAVRSIRDANWVKFSYDKAGCWNMRPEVTDCKDPTAKQIAQGNYTIDVNLSPNDYRWAIPNASLPAILDLNVSGNGNDPYQLWYYDINAADGAGSHDILASLSSSGATKNDESRFYRMIQINYPATGLPADQEMDVISTVQWKAQGVTHQVVLTSKLTNYQKVKVK